MTPNLEELHAQHREMLILRRALAIAPIPRSTARISQRILQYLAKGPQKVMHIVERIHWMGTVFLLERMAVDGMLTISDRNGETYVTLALPAELSSRVMAALANGSLPASILQRKFAKDEHYLAGVLAGLESAGKVLRIQGKHGFRYELVSHTPTEPDACPLVADASPV